MTVRYVDSELASGDDDGTSWINAYRTFQQALTAAVAGDIVYCKGTEEFADATARTAANSGDVTSGWIKFIGCNAAGTVDGTYFTLDVNNQDTHGLIIDGDDMLWLENIRITNTGGTLKDCLSFATAASTGHVFIHCSFDNSNRSGIYDASLVGAYCLFYRCVIYANAGAGYFGAAVDTLIAFCRIYDNGLDGFTSCYSTLFGCLIYDNGDDGVDFIPSARLINCVIDGNADDGIFHAASTSLYAGVVLGCRVTNQTVDDDDSGINCNSKHIVVGWCYVDDNGDSDDDDFINDTLMQFIPIASGTTTTNTQGSDSNEGYTDVTTEDEHDFNLVPAATKRREPITIPET